MTLKIRPMLACQCEPQLVKYPVIVQPKLDGIRVLIKDGVAYSRTLKPIRNRYVQKRIEAHANVLEGVDGELMVGDPTDPMVYRYTSSGIMSESGEPNFMLHAFDIWNVPEAPYQKRSAALVSRDLPLDLVVPVINAYAATESELMDHHYRFTKEGYEGTILRHPLGLYKYNRSTMREGYLIKFKDFKDAEAMITGFIPKYQNANPAGLDERGYTKRSTHMDNLVKLDTLGALEVIVDDGPEFSIGTGFDDALRKHIWDRRDHYLGKMVKFKYFEGGAYAKPRFPVFLGFRDPIDQ